MTNAEFDKEYNRIRTEAIAIGLNWPRMIGVADQRYGDDWEQRLEMLKECLQAAKMAPVRGKDPHSVVRARLIFHMIGQIEELLDDGQYDLDE